MKHGCRQGHQTRHRHDT